MSTVTETIKKFKLLRGRHSEGGSIIPAPANHKGPIFRVAEGVNYIKTPVKTYKNSRDSEFEEGDDIIETSINLLKFNAPGSTKFALLDHYDAAQQGMSDGLEKFTVAKLRKMAEDDEIDLEGVTKKAEILAAIRNQDR